MLTSRRGIVTVGCYRVPTLSIHLLATLQYRVISSSAQRTAERCIHVAFVTQERYSRRKLQMQGLPLASFLAEYPRAINLETSFRSTIRSCQKYLECTDIHSQKKLAVCILNLASFFFFSLGEFLGSFSTHHENESKERNSPRLTVQISSFFFFFKVRFLGLFRPILAIHSPSTIEAIENCHFSISSVLSLYYKVKNTSFLHSGYFRSEKHRAYNEIR